MQPPEIQRAAEKRSRIEFIDCLRGFALAGICIVHFMEQYLGAQPPPGMDNYGQHGGVDPILEGVAFVLIRGKGFALFSFMFGLSFALQLIRREEGVGKGRFVWRMVILLLISIGHSLFYRGDILSIYALLAVPLLWFEKLKDKTLIIIAVIMMLGAPRMIITAVQPKVSVEAAATAKEKDEANAVAHFKTSKEGPFLKAMQQNVTTGVWDRLGFQFGEFSRGYQTFAYFLLGLIAGRNRWFENLEANAGMFRRLCRWAGGLSIAIPVLGLLVAIVFKPGQGAAGSEASPWLSVVGFSVYDAWNFANTLLYIAAFALLFQRARWNRVLSRLAPFGRMALTNYISQSLLGGLVFFSFGLGKLGDIGSLATFSIALVVIGLQMVVSRIWLAQFRFGPLEWVWRCLTKLSLEPLRRS